MNTLRQCQWLRALAFLIAFGSLAWYPVGTFANPLGEVVIHGDVGFARNGSTLDIMQSSNRAIIEWQSFNIANGESTVFHQPGATAAALNRVVGGSQSVIDGMLRANGNVWIINQSGIIMGRNSRVDVNGLLLSTLDVPNDEFLRGGDMTFSGSSSAPVVNFGTINAASGNVYVFAQQVENHGYIGAVDGRVVMMGGNEVLLRQGGSDGNISVKGTVGYGHVVNTGVVEGGQVDMQAVNNNAMAMAVQQKGTVRITGAEKRNGRVLLVAQGGAGLSQEGVVNTGGGSVKMQSAGQVQIGGTTDASSTDSAGGAIEVIGREINITPAGVLRSNGTTGGNVKLDASESLDLSGSVETTGTSAMGGTASLTGNEVFLRTGAVVDANGATGGGQIFIGGGFQGANLALRNATNTVVETGATIRASALESGDGGLVAVWANGATDFQGSIFAEGVGNGGVVEVSGRDVLGFNGGVSTLGRSGNNGTLLLDPVNVTISASGTPGSISAAALQTAWLNGNVVVHTFGGDASTAGNVNIEEDVQIINPGVTLINGVNVTNANSFSILAHGDINVGTGSDFNGSVSIRHGGAGNINLVAGWLPNPNSQFTADLANNPQLMGAPFLTQAIGSKHFDPNYVEPDPLLAPSGYFGSYGADGSTGVIRLNPDSNRQSAIYIGSAGGETNLLARSLLANAGDTANEPVHVGWYHDGSNNVDVTGNVNVWLSQTTGESLIARAGIQTRQYVQFGHGGAGENINPANGSKLSGNVNIISPALTVLQAGRGDSAYVLVGHGGRLLRNVAAAEGDGIHSLKGDISVDVGQLILTAGTGSVRNFALIGHGGMDIDGTDSTHPLVTEANIVVNSQEGILLAGGRQDAFAQIGSGGMRVRGNHTGSIQVTTENGDIEMISASTGAQFVGGSPVMIGFGGYDSDGAHLGNISVEARNGSIQMIGGSGNVSFVQIGNGGAFSAVEPDGNADNLPLALTSGGDITVRALENIQLLGNDGTAAGVSAQYVQIGHGGNDADGTRLGNIVVEATTGSISLDSSGLNNEESTSTDVYTQIGLGGRDSSGNHTGSITVTAGGDISLKGGYENNRISLIGHGGRFDTSLSGTPTFSNSDGGLISGDINVTSGGKVSVTGGGATLADDSATIGDITFAMIGHSLFSARSSAVFSTAAWGNISVNAATGVALQGGTRDWTFAAIGHGLQNSQTADDFVIGDPGAGRSANVSVSTTTGDITVRGGGFSGFDTSASTEFWRYAAIGHHGAAAGFDVNADISVAANAGNIIVEGGSQRFTGARIGHGGDEMNRGTNRHHVLQGSINVSALAGNVRVLGGTGYTPVEGQSNASAVPELSYGMIGHGGARLGQAGNFRSYRLQGDVLVEGRNVDVQGGDGSGNFAAIGHGAYQRDAAGFGSLILGGDVTVNATYDVDINGGDAMSNSIFDAVILDQDRFVRNEGNFGQIGHFGIPVGATGSSGMTNQVSTDSDLAIVVSAGRDISLNRKTYLAGGSWGRGAHAMIGVGGNGYVSVDSNGNLPTLDVSATVDVAAGRDISLYGATAGRTYFPQSKTYNTIVAGAGSFAQIGNGGVLSNSGNGGLSGDVNVRAGNDILLRTGVQGNPAVTSGVTIFDNYAKIGHGDYTFQSGARSTEGFRSGNIEVAAGGDIWLQGALIGHIDQRYSEAKGLEGSTYVAVNRYDNQGPAYQDWLLQLDRYSRQLAAYDAYVGDPATKARLYSALLTEYNRLNALSGRSINGGSLYTSSNSEGFSSSIQANLIGDLRIYTPTRSQNQISETTLLNGLLAYDYPEVPLLRTYFDAATNTNKPLDEEYDANMTFEFNNGVPMGPLQGQQYSLRGGALAADADAAAAAGDPTVKLYATRGSYMIYYDRDRVIPVRRAPDLPPPPQIAPNDLPEDDRYDYYPELLGLGDPNLTFASRMAGLSSTYPRGTVEEDVTGITVGGGIYRPFEVFDWRALLDWQTGGVTWVPGAGFVPVSSIQGASADAVPEVPAPGGAAPAGTNAFDFNFGAGAPQDDEVERKNKDAMEGAAAPAGDMGAGDMGGAAPADAPKTVTF